MSGGGGGSRGDAGRYERQEQIGSGTFGHAWLVRSRASGRHYVVKEIKVTALPEHEREQSVNEVAILSRCKHVNIIRYKEAFIDQLTGSLNIVMEYADGGDLYARIVNQRAANDYFPEGLILNWFIQITFAVQYLHSKNILHRDLKTQNIFLTSENLVKVGDFGIARTLRSTQELATTAIGTPYYLSPEICQRQPYNHKSDQWAVGCIVYEMCCLTHPFNASSFENLVLKILQARYSPIPSQYSLLLRDLVTVLLRTQPDRRPSAEQVLMIPALKPHVDTYVKCQNAAMSPSGSHRITTNSTQSSHNGSDDRNSLTSSQEDVCVSSMTADSLESAGTGDFTGVASDPHTLTSVAAPNPASVQAPADLLPERLAQHAWCSQFANELKEQADLNDREKPSAAVTSDGRRRFGHAVAPLGMSAAVNPRQRSSSLSSLRPESQSRSALDEVSEHSSNIPSTSASKQKGRGQASRGPSALIRQVLKNKFSRQEAQRPRSASDPTEPSSLAGVSSCPRRARSPSRLIRRPSLSLANGGTPQSSRSHRSPGAAMRSHSPAQQSLSPATGGSSRASPPLVRRNARLLDAPTPRSAGTSTARPWENLSVSRTELTVSVTSNMSTNSNTTTDTRGHPTIADGAIDRTAILSEVEEAAHDNVAAQNQREAGMHCNGSVVLKATNSQRQESQRSGGFLPDMGVRSGQEHHSSHQRPSVDIERRQPEDVSSKGEGSPVSLVEKKSQQERRRTDDKNDMDSDSQEGTLVSLPVNRLPKFNHNNVAIAGGHRHARFAEFTSACCSLICAECRYAKDEQLARLMWSTRLCTVLPADDTSLLQHLTKILGADRLNAVLDRLLADWENDDAGSFNELLLAVGREHVHLVPVMVQIVQLRMASGGHGLINSPPLGGCASSNTL